MTETRRLAEVKSAVTGVVSGLATFIALFAFWALARAQAATPNVTPINNGENSVIGASGTTTNTHANSGIGNNALYESRL